jgi:hypothetical protein
MAYGIIVDHFMMVKTAYLTITDDCGIRFEIVFEINHFNDMLAFPRNNFYMTTNVRVIFK